MLLARKFCPIIHLNREAGREENFQPDPVQLMINSSFIRNLRNPDFYEKAAVAELMHWSRNEYYLDIADSCPQINSIADYKAVYDLVKENFHPTIYARVKNSIDYTIIQYWLFYYLNDWRNIHEGDWELVQLHFPKHTAKELLVNDLSPVSAAYSQHQGGQKMTWNDMNDKGLVRETHPIVYVAQGSHANYFTPGQFWSGLDFDDTGSSLWKIIEPEQLDIVLLTESENENGEPEWLEFQGHWGEYLGSPISVLGLIFERFGPFGPQWITMNAKSPNNLLKRTLILTRLPND